MLIINSRYEQQALDLLDEAVHSTVKVQCLQGTAVGLCFKNELEETKAEVALKGSFGFQVITGRQ